MNNYPVTGIGPSGKKETVWKDRSVVVTNYVFCMDNDFKWRILATMRGSANGYEGLWNCQCGYIDWDEDDQEAAIRETFEETGVVIDKKLCKFHSYTTNPKDCGNQQISFRWYTVLPGKIDDYRLTLEHNEPNECQFAEWIKIDDVPEYTWAFGHDHMLMKIFSEKIDSKY